MAILNRPLRVMHIISGDLWAGAETQAFTLLTQLQRQVQLCVVLMNDGELAGRLRLSQIPAIILPETELNTLQIFFRLVRQIAVFAPDVVHTHRQKENILGGLAFFLNRLVGRSRVSLRTQHGAQEFAPSRRQQLQLALDRFVGRYLQRAVIAVSADLQGKLVANFPSQQVHLVRNGVDIEALLARVSPLPRAQTPPYTIGMVGRLEPVKRVDIFLQMAAILVQRAPGNWCFQVIGDGKLRAELEQSADALGLSDCVKFLGYQTNVLDCLAALDAVVMCSDHEGTPMAALEALALGKPILAHDVGGLSELLSSYPSMLVADHQPTAYAQALENLMLTDTPLRPHLPVDYTATFNAQATLELYLQLTGQK
jgi:L-malate glycosyltransferase